MMLGSDISIRQLEEMVNVGLVGRDGFVETKPCPACRKDNVKYVSPGIFHRFTNHPFRGRITCLDCGCTGPYAVDELAAIKWNQMPRRDAPTKGK